MGAEVGAEAEALAAEGGGSPASHAPPDATREPAESPTRVSRVTSLRANEVLVPEAPCVEQPRQKELALELLELIIVLVTEQPVRWLAGPVDHRGGGGGGGVPAVVRRELLHVLATGSTSFGALAERAQTACTFYERGYEVSTEDLSACVHSLALQRESFGASGMSSRILVLRPEAWLEFDPCFMFLGRSEREAARQRWAEEPDRHWEQS